LRKLADSTQVEILELDKEHFSFIPEFLQVKFQSKFFKEKLANDEKWISLIKGI